MNGRTIPRILTRIAIITMVISAIGLIASLALNKYVFDDDYAVHAAYGDMPMPTATPAKQHLPAGDVTVFLHTGSLGGSLVPPNLRVLIRASDGERSMTDDHGSSTTEGDDTYLRIGHLDVPADGDYDVKAEGDVKDYQQPMLAFGRPTNLRVLPLAFGIAFGLAVVLFLVARVWASRLAPAPASGPPLSPAVNGGSVPPRPADEYISPQRAAPTIPNVPTQQAAPTVPTVTPQQAAPTLPNVPTQQAAPTVPIVPPQQADSAIPSDEREKALKSLAELRDSGVLTDEEYEAEKKSVLEGG
jgi:hypothetical protein